MTLPEGVTRETFIPQDVRLKLERMGSVLWNSSHEQFSVEELKNRLRGVAVCLTGWGCAMLDEQALEHAADLKLIAHTGGSVAPLVSEDVFARGIKVISGNELYAESVAEGVLGYVLASLRELPHYDREMRAGRWRPESFYNEGLLDQTLGLVGFGMVARSLVRLLAPFRVKVKVFAKPEDAPALKAYGVQAASLEEVFTTCKIISLHVPQVPDTYHMVNDKLLAMIPPGAILVNTARGSVIDETALIRELRTGRFKAVLDVYEKEPLPKDSELRQLDNTVLIPHMAGPTIDRRKFVTLSLMEDIERFYAGQPLKYEISQQYAVSMTR